VIDFNGSFVYSIGLIIEPRSLLLSILVAAASPIADTFESIAIPTSGCCRLVKCKGAHAPAAPCHVSTIENKQEHLSVHSN
jgi:hypothetical protein